MTSRSDDDPSRNRQTFDGAADTPRLGSESVSHARFGDDVLRARRVGLQFSSQVADIHSQQMLDIFVVRATPHLTHQLTMSKKLVRMDNKRFEQTVLSRRKLHLLSRGVARLCRQDRR